MARDDYEVRRARQRQGVQIAKAAGKYTGRKADTAMHQRILSRTAELTGCSISQVKRIWYMYQKYS